MMRGLGGRCLLALTMSSALAVTLVAPAADAGVSKGVVVVTAYARVVPSGSYGAVTVMVQGKKAAAVRSALSELAKSSSGPICMEGDSEFQISVLPKRGARPSSLATEEDCPTPGVVFITMNGKATPQPFREDCALRAAVIAVLPPGRGRAIREDKNPCSS